MDRERMYVICDAELSPGLKVAQSGHAIVAYALRFPAELRRWHDTSNVLVCLETTPGDLGHLVEDLARQRLRFVRFHEPDMGCRLTAVAVEPAAARLLARLPLACAELTPTP